MEIFYLDLESSSASRKWKNLNVVLFADSVHRVSTKRSKRDTLKKIFFGFFQTKFKILQGNCKMTNGKCIYHNTVDYMSWMALEKDDFRRLSTIWEFRGPRRALHQGWKWPLNNSVNQSQLYCHVSVSHSSKLKLVRNQWKDIAFLVRFNVKQNFVFWHADRNLSRLKKKKTDTFLPVSIINPLHKCFSSFDKDNNGKHNFQEILIFIMRLMFIIFSLIYTSDWFDTSKTEIRNTHF